MYRLRKSNIAYFIIGVIQVLIFSYPYSPFLYAVFSISAQYMFVFLTFIPFLIFLKKIKNPLIIKRFAHNSYLLIGIIILTVSFLSTYNFTAIRDILIAFMCITIFHLYKYKEYLIIYKYYILIMSALLSIAIIILTLTGLDVFSRYDWLYTEFNLSESNPLYLRGRRFDFEWSLILGYLVYAYDASAFFQRWTLIFLEPSHLSSFVLVPFLILLINKKSILYRFILILLGISFLFSASVWGFLAAIIGTIAALFGIIFFNESYKYFILLVILLVLSLFSMAYFPQVKEIIYYILPENKISQIEAKINMKSFFQDFSIISMWGEENIQKLSETEAYGSEVIFYRYGLIGGTFYIMSFLWFIFLACRWLFEKNLSKSKRVLCFIAIFSSAAFSLKSPNSIFLIQPFIAHCIIHALYQTRQIQQ